MNEPYSYIVYLPEILDYVRLLDPETTLNVGQQSEFYAWKMRHTYRNACMRPMQQVHLRVRSLTLWQTRLAS